MPTKTRERSLYAPGSLVKARKDIYSIDPDGRVNVGTIGTILSGPKPGYPHHCWVHFVARDDPWWVNFAEIEPHY
tara:strand:+ start:32 stop:256 length:225 start_codon:yes stop_codon:yes gene_type:complete